jgi:transcription elongation GreA/GreB family factor
VDRTPLSEEARRSLEERLRVLEDERTPRLEHELEVSRDASIAAALRATRNEAVQVREALSSASALEDIPHDPTKVELGDTVTVRREGSSVRERFTVWTRGGSRSSRRSAPRCWGPGSARPWWCRRRAAP